MIVVENSFTLAKVFSPKLKQNKVTCVVRKNGRVRPGTPKQ